MTHAQVDALITWYDSRAPLMRELAIQDRSLTPDRAKELARAVADLDQMLRAQLVGPSKETK